MQRLRARRAEFKQMQCEMGNKQGIVGHIEKQEEPDVEEVMMETHMKEEKVTEPTQAEKVTEQDDATTEEENPTGMPWKRKMQSVTDTEESVDRSENKGTTTKI